MAIMLSVLPPPTMMASMLMSCCSKVCCSGELLSHTEPVGFYREIVAEGVPIVDAIGLSAEAVGRKQIFGWGLPVRG